MVKLQEINKKQVEEQKVTVLLDWTPNTNHTGLYVAKDKGYYAEEGLEVAIIQPTGDGTQLVATGKADFAVSAQESVTIARASDIPVVSIAAIIQHNTSAFASLSESNITTVKDFEGKRYGSWGSPIEKATIKSAMDDAGADYEKLINVTIGETDFFTSIGRDNDFQWVFYGWDGIEAKRRGINLSFIYLKDLNPVLDYYTPIIITSEKNVTENKELVAKFMRATAKGYEFAISNASESADILLKNAPETNADLVKLSQEWLSQQYRADAPQWGVQKPEVWKGYADWLYAHELLEKQIDTTKAFTNEFLPKR
ncbi:MAG TPA: ABC transporter substrate-binding protein [Patescibacteria group bacterium]|nr:ABC transporter substrate-binding protein [Patescibacteria group bacterium]